MGWSEVNESTDIDWAKQNALREQWLTFLGDKQNWPALARYYQPSSSIGLQCYAALAYWQTSTTLLESGHSEYVINEIWGPAAGYNTYQEFIPQYVYLIGWLVKPIL